jgi:hypothetical protein
MAKKKCKISKALKDGRNQSAAGMKAYMNAIRKCKTKKVKRSAKKKAAKKYKRKCDSNIKRAVIRFAKKNNLPSPYKVDTSL